MTTCVLHDLTHNRQPQPGTFAALPALAKAQEHGFALLWRNTLPLVADLQLQVPGHLAQGHLNSALAVDQGVFQQVTQSFTQLIGIAPAFATCGDIHLDYPTTGLKER